MLGKILKAVGHAAFWGKMLTAGVLMVLSAASVEIFAKRAHLRSGKIDGNVYIIGKRSNPVAVCVTNVSPVKFAINVIKGK